MQSERNLWKVADRKKVTDAIISFVKARNLELECARVLTACGELF